MQLALEFYGPMFLLYSVYDGARDKDSVAPMLSAHIDRFIARGESDDKNSEAPHNLNERKICGGIQKN